MTLLLLLPHETANSDPAAMTSTASNHGSFRYVPVSISEATRNLRIEDLLELLAQIALHEPAKALVERYEPLTLARQVAAPTAGAADLALDQRDADVPLDLAYFAPGAPIGQPHPLRRLGERPRFGDVLQQLNA